MPEKILDLHTHLFNARYIPLASIIASAMNKDKSELANNVANLLHQLTDSSYQVPSPVQKRQLLSKMMKDMNSLEKFCNIAEHELLRSTGSYIDLQNSRESIISQSKDAPIARELINSDLLKTIIALSEINYVNEGWTGALPKDVPIAVSRADFDKSFSIGDIFNWIRGVIMKALSVVVKLMDPKIWGMGENYLEFFLTMLKSEKDMVKKVFTIYGKNLPPIQIVHHLMDMQLAFGIQNSPHYSFYPEQLDKMQILQQENQGRLFGFSAFDPRRENWQEIVEQSRKKGFLGFKFYPSMGYMPIGNEMKIQERINNFFDYCIEYDLPIFTHCTPVGFQTREKLGHYAHPKYWREVLQKDRWKNLRLCLGHAGGGDNRDHETLKSAGWMANSDKEWQHPDNFAYIVSELCNNYPNVYCDVGYITELFDEKKRLLFVDNIERARKMINGSNFLNKLAYGSDWHMPEMIDNTRDYLDIFLEIFNRNSYKMYLNKFFWENGYQYLKI